VGIAIAAVLGGIVLVAALVLAVTLLVRLVSKLDTPPVAPRTGPARRLASTEPEAVTSEASMAVEEALEDLERGDDPRRVVIACWVRLERTVAKRGVKRQPFETSGELVGRVLGKLHPDPSALDRLHVLYRRARFSTAELGILERHAARDALRRMRSDVVQGAAAPPGEDRT
jgi:hypothetical protein